MLRRVFVICLAVALVAGLAACGKKKASNPIAHIDSKQPDKVLFDRAMQAMKSNKYDVARMTLQTLINTYPDSEFVARAKLAIGDAWYQEGGSAAWAQAESEYKDFGTFYPNMPEAAEAQLKVANIHYQQMEKPDRDYTHARRAEEEYRYLIQQYPESKLVPEAKKKLLEVQEVLGEREYRIGHFYFTRESWAAAIARLRSLSDTYPLFSHTDDALWELGESYEHQITLTRNFKGGQAEGQQRLIKDLENRAAEAYSRVLTRYPMSDHNRDARRRLEALHRPVPQATPEAIAQHKAEMASRGRNRQGRLARATDGIRHRPNVTAATKVGEPTMTDPRQTSAVEVVKNSMDIMTGKTGASEVQVDTGAPKQAPAGDRVPRSDTAPGPAGAPSQVNEAAGAAPDSSASSSSQSSGQDSSSQTKKKKGLRRLNPF